MKVRVTPRALKALATATSAAALAITVLIKPWEGEELEAYLDTVAAKPVWTICSGETKDVNPGMKVTAEWCEARLKMRVENDYEKPLKACIPGFDQHPISVRAMFIDLAYNVGVGAVCKSTAARRLKANDHRGACEALTWFNKAGREVVRGLQNRREYGDAWRIGGFELCIAGLK